MPLLKEGLWENVVFLAVDLVWVGSCEFALSYLLVFLFLKVLFFLIQYISAKLLEIH